MNDINSICVSGEVISDPIENVGERSCVFRVRSSRKSLDTLEIHVVQATVEARGKLAERVMRDCKESQKIWVVGMLTHAQDSSKLIIRAEHIEFREVK